MSLVERARRIVRNYPEHVARREQAQLILELANEVQRLGTVISKLNDWCAENKQWEAIRVIGELTSRPPEV